MVVGKTAALAFADSTVIIDLLDPDAPRNAVVRQAVAAHPEGLLCVSNLVRLEVSVGPFTRNVQSEIDRLDVVLEALTRLDMPQAVYVAAARLRARHGLKTPDALHLATALHHGCGEFWTNDIQLAKKSMGLAFRTF